jgi:CDP-diacylglycerol--serine O-phosphatidyltransferase
MPSTVSFRFFKFKDVFTLVNLLLGLWAAILAVEGRVVAASILVFVNWHIDGLDGLVARLTKTSNLFGMKFDDLTDLFAFSVAPGFIAYAVYRPFEPRAAVALCSFIIAVGTVRLARNQAEPVAVPGFWIGLPRPAMGLFVIFLLNSRLFIGHRLFVPGIAAVVVLGFLSLTRVPYISNKTKFNVYQIALIVGVPLASIPFAFVGGWWDYALSWMIVYFFTPWIGLKPRTRRDVGRRIEEALRNRRP